MHCKGGHRARALQLTENAINEVNKVLATGKRHPESTASASAGTGAVLRDELFDQWLTSGL